MTEDNILQKITQRPIETMEVTPDIIILQFPLVNSLLVGDPKKANTEWVLVGAGMAHTAKSILTEAENRFGKGSKPAAIILSHGHFDHVGAITELVNQWNTVVYAHGLEMPYLTGQQDYPPADPTVSQGLIAEISPTFPNQSINLRDKVKALPEDGGVPGMPGWRWIHTPGHSPGHVSFFRDSDKVLIVGDAFTTLNQNDAESVLSRKKELHGPPAYFTVDWQAAKNSVETLKNLNPAIAISSHGLPVEGNELKQQLERLVNNFEQESIPEHGKYVNV
ncbi:MAG: MBL fold metallo-hydrolase [Bacillota bacterium]